MASFKLPPPILALILFSQFSLIKGHYKNEDVPTDLNDRGLIIVKIWCLIILFIVTFGCGLIPYFFRKRHNFLMFANQFAGGVFLAISMHFLGDAADVTDDYTEGSSFLPFLFVLIGYVITLFVESIVFKVKSKDGETEAFVRVEEGIKDDESTSDQVGNYNNPRLVRRAAVEVSVILILGLAFHSAFEGISIGLAERKRYARQYLWEISIHKVFLALGLGVAVLRTQPKRPLLEIVAYALAFAISAPIGIIVSLIIKESAQNDTADWVYALSQGIACGAFLHVSLYHILGKGFNPQDQPSYKSPFRRFFALFFGVLGVTIGSVFA